MRHFCFIFTKLFRKSCTLRAIYSLICLTGIVVILSLCKDCWKASLGEQGFCTQILALQQTQNPLHHCHRTKPRLRTNLTEETIETFSLSLINDLSFFFLEIFMEHLDILLCTPANKQNAWQDYFHSIREHFTSQF